MTRGLWLSLLLTSTAVAQAPTTTPAEGAPPDGEPAEGAGSEYDPRAMRTEGLDDEAARSRFRIEGHTDTVGDPGMNQALSERRAAAVRDMLVQQHGIAATRLDPVGFGESTLLVPTGDGRDEPRNRRVQVINLGE